MKRVNLKLCNEIPVLNFISKDIDFNRKINTKNMAET